MDQIDQLKALRDEAFARIEEARRALEESADGKMVSSLDALIRDLEEDQTGVFESDHGGSFDSQEEAVTEVPGLAEAFGTELAEPDVSSDEVLAVEDSPEGENGNYGLDAAGAEEIAEPPVSEAEPTAIEEISTSVIEEALVEEEVSVEEEAPVFEDLPAFEDLPVSEEVPAAVEAAMPEPAPYAEETPVSDEFSNHEADSPAEPGPYADEVANDDESSFLERIPALEPISDTVAIVSSEESPTPAESSQEVQPAAENVPTIPTLVLPPIALTPNHEDVPPSPNEPDETPEEALPQNELVGIEPAPEVIPQESSVPFVQPNENQNVEIVNEDVTPSEDNAPVTLSLVLPEEGVPTDSEETPTSGIV